MTTHYECQFCDWTGDDFREHKRETQHLVRVQGTRDTPEPYYRAIHKQTCEYRLAGPPHPCTCCTPAHV